MAAMNYEMARAAAEKLIQAGRANGLTREALISQIIAGAPAAGGAPQGAIASALMPPVEATPATPVREGVPFVAPKPVASAQPQAEAMPVQGAEPQPAAATPRPSEFRPMLESTLAEIAASEGAMSQAAANNQPVNIIEQARLRGLKERARQLQDRVAAQEGAEVPEEMRAALKGRQERLSRREELLQESKARSPWEALLAGGAAMAQGRRGENFGEALSRGLQAGIQDYGRSRRESVEGAESLGEARDKVVMDRYNMLQKARADAVALVNSGQDVDVRTMQLANLTSENALKAALAPFAVRKGSAEAEAAEFEARNASRVLEAELGVKGATAEYYRRRPGGGSEGGTKGLSTLLSSFDREANELNKTIRDITAPSDKKIAAAQRLAEVNQERNRIRSQISSGGGAAGAAGAAGSAEPNFVYVPGKGLKPNK